MIEFMPGLEYLLDYQGPTSPFAQDLVKLFDEVFLYRESLIANGISNRNVIKKVREYCDKPTFKNKFIEILEKHSGLRFENINMQKGPIGFFAIQWKPARGLVSSYFSYSNLTKKLSRKDRLPDNRQKIENELKEIRSSVSHDLGKVINKEVASKLFSDYSNILYFDVDSAFNVTNFHEKAIPLTSPQLSAIILHEVGHVLSYIYKVSTLSDTLVDMLRPVTVSETSVNKLKARAKECLKYVDETEKAYPQFKVSDLTKKAITDLEILLDETPKSPKWQQILAVMLLSGCGNQLLDSICSFIILTMINEAIASVTTHNLNTTKTSDFQRGFLDMTNTEYEADKYVANHGLSDDLVQGLHNIVNNAQLVNGALFRPIRPRKELFNYALLSQLTMLQEVYYSRSGSFSMYGTTIQRYTANKETVLKQIRSSEIPPEMKEDLVISYANIRNMIEVHKAEMKKTLGYKFNNALAEFLLAPGKGMLTFASGKQDSQLLMQLAMAMYNNELIYQVERLKQS